MLSDREPAAQPSRRDPVWSRWDIVCAISLVAACVLVSFALPSPGGALFGG